MDRRFNNLVTALSTKDEEIKGQKEKIGKLLDALSIFVTPKGDSSTTRPFRFLELPTELRLAVYELCLVKGTVYLTPRPKYDHRYDGIGPFEKPEWLLLSINRQIRVEAVNVFLQKNHFVLSYDADAETNLCCSMTTYWLNRQPLSLPVLTRSNVMSVSIALDLRNISQDPLEIADSGAELTESDEKSRMEALHVARIADLEIQWRLMCRAFRQAKFLQVDITNVYCPHGCHRYIQEAAAAIAHAITRKSIPGTLEILGTKSSWERTVVKEELAKRLVYANFSQGHHGVIRFRSLKCHQYCLSLHQKRFEHNLEDEEIDVDTLMRLQQ